DRGPAPLATARRRDVRLTPIRLTALARQGIRVDVTPLPDTDPRKRRAAEFQHQRGERGGLSAVPIHTSTGRVLVADGVVSVRELEEHDDEVARVVSEADDPVAATSSCLRIGARALRAAHVSVDVDVIERSFADLEHRFESRVSAAVDEIARST